MDGEEWDGLESDGRALVIQYSILNKYLKAVKKPRKQALRQMDLSYKINSLFYFFFLHVFF